MKKKNQPVVTSTISSSCNIIPTYLVNSKTIDPVAKVYNLNAPARKFDLYVNDVQINLGPNVHIVDVTDNGINISFKK